MEELRAQSPGETPERRERLERLVDYVARCLRIKPSKRPREPFVTAGAPPRASD